MKCIAVIREISNYIDGELEPELKQELERHLENCEECRLVVDQTRRTVQIFCGSELVELPKEIQERLQQALRSSLKRK